MSGKPAPCGALCEGKVTKHFITGAARSVTNSVERLTALRKAHPEWNEALSPKAAARERLAMRTSTTVRLNGGTPQA
jgi:hypothetical protein